MTKIYVKTTRVSGGRRAPAPLFFLILLSILISSFPQIGHGPAIAHAERPDSRQEPGTWIATKIWADVKPLYVSVVGDIWPGHPGNEIIVGGESNWTTMIYGHEDSWVAQRLFQEAWYVTNVAIGDVDPAEPGLEMVNVGWHGNVSMVYWEDATSAWKHKELVNGNDAGLTWGYGIAIGDMDPRYPGNEVAATDDSGNLLMIRKNGTTWTYERIWQDVGPDIIDPYLDTVVLGEVDPAHPGDEMLLTGGSKYVTEIYYNTTANNWTVKRLWRDKSSPIQLAIGDIINSTAGNEIALGGLSKNLTVLSWNGTEWVSEKVYQEQDVIYDLDYGVLRQDKGPQVVIGSWSSNVTGHRKTPGGSAWDSEQIFNDDNFVFGTTIGDCDDLHPGNELLVVDRSGVIRKVQYETPDFVLYSPAPENTVVPGSSVTYDIMAYSRGDFHNEVSISVVGQLGDWTASVSPSKVTPTGRSTLTVTVPLDAPEGDATLTVQGKSGAKVHIIELKVRVLPPGEKDFSIVAVPATQSVVADYTAKFTIAIASLNGFSEIVSISVQGLPDGTSATIRPISVTAPGSAALNVTTVSSSPVGTHYLTIKGVAGTRQHTVTVALIIKDASSPDFSMTLGPPTITMVGSHSENVTVNLVSLFGFSGSVTLSTPGLLHGMSASFTPPNLVPSGTSMLNLTVNASVPAGTYYVLVEGRTGDTAHSAGLRVDLNTAGDPNFRLMVWPKQVNVTASYPAFYNISVSPENDFAAKVSLSVKGLPADTTAVFSPQSIGPFQYSKLEIKTLVSAPPGTYSLEIKAYGSGLEKVDHAVLTILRPKPLLNIVRVEGIPSTAEVGQNIKIKAWIENKGLVGAPDCKMNLIVDKVALEGITFSAPVGGVTEVNATWTAKEGVHNITVWIVSATPADFEEGSYSKTVKVTDPVRLMGNSILWLVLAIFLIVLVAIGAGFLMGRKGKGPVPEEDEDELEEFRPRRKGGKKKQLDEET